QQKVPQLFGGTGADSIAAHRAQYPWTIGYLPSFTGEGRVYGRDIAKHHPNAKIAVLYEDSEYGQELFEGVREGLGIKGGPIMILARPKQAISAFVSAHQLGWQPRCYVTSVSIDPAVMAIVKFNGAGSLANGAVSTAFLHDPTNPAQRKAKGVLLYNAIMKRYG